MLSTQSPLPASCACRLTSLLNAAMHKKASCKIRPYTSKSSLVSGRSSYPLLGAGALTAHEVYRLMLLGSPPDMVHSSSLRKTHSSTQQNTTQFRGTRPSSEESTPAVADFRYRVPLIPRLVWPYFTACTASDITKQYPHLYYNRFPTVLQVVCEIFLSKDSDKTIDNILFSFYNYIILF